MEKIFNRIVWFTGLVLIQVLIFNKICWLGVATPFVYVYFLLGMDCDEPPCAQLLWAFMLGLCVDVFSNMWGINAAACVLLAFVRPWLIRMFVSHEEYENFEPSMAVMGKGAFIFYILLAVSIHHAVLFLLDAFSLVYIAHVLLRILGSVLFTCIFVVCIDLIRHRQ